MSTEPKPAFQHAPRGLDAVRNFGHAYVPALLVWLGVSQPWGSHKQRRSAALLFMVLMAQGSHFVAAADHAAAEAVEVEGLVKVTTKAVHEAIARRAKAPKALQDALVITNVRQHASTRAIHMVASTTGARVNALARGRELFGPSTWSWPPPLPPPPPPPPSPPLPKKTVGYKKHH